MSFNETLGETSEIDSQASIKDKPCFNPSKQLEKIINQLRNNPSPNKLKKLPLSLAMNISPKELKTLLSLIQTYSNAPDIQESILQSLNKGLTIYFGSECEQINKREKILYTRTNSYFYFDRKRNLNETLSTQTEESKVSTIEGESIEKENRNDVIIDANEMGIKFSKLGDDNSSFVNQKEFSFLIWIYPQKMKTSANIKEAFIAEFSEAAKGPEDTISKFSIFLTSNLSINIKYSRNKALQGKQGAIVNNQWNCIGISIRKVKGRDEAEYLIMYKNGCLNPHYELLSYSYPEGNFKHFCIGGPIKSMDSNESYNSELSPYFLFWGKIASVYLSKKFFSHPYFDRISEFSNKLILRCNYDSIGNKLMLKEILDSIIFKWESSCDQRLVFSTIADALAVSGGLNIWIPLIRECSREGIIYILRIIGTICQVTNYLDETLSSNFFEILGVALEDKNLVPNEDFLYRCEDIVIYLERSSEQDLVNSLQSRAMNSIFLSKGIWKNLPFNLLKEYLDFVSKYISILFYKKEDILKFIIVVNTLKDIVFKDIVSIKEKIKEEPYSLISKIMQEILKTLQFEDKEINEINEPKTPKNSKNNQNEIVIEANVIIKILLMMIEKEIEEVLIDHCLEAGFNLKCKNEEIDELFEKALILFKEQKESPIIQKYAAIVAIKLIFNFIPCMWEWDNMNRRMINFHHDWGDVKRRVKKLCKSFKNHLNGNNIYPIAFLLLEKEMKNKEFNEMIQMTLPEIRRKLNSLINILTDRISCYLTTRNKIRVNNMSPNTENDQIEIYLIQDFPKLHDLGELHLKEIFELLTGKVEGLENETYRLYLHNSANFPKWVIDAYNIFADKDEQYQIIPSLKRFVLAIFSKKAKVKNPKLKNFTKLREFLIGIGNINYNDIFDFLGDLLYNMKKCFKKKKKWFFEYLSILEDLLNPHFVNISHIDCEKFKNLIKKIFEFSFKSAKCHRVYYPEFIFVDLLTLSSLLDSTSPNNYSSQCIYLRNGGYIRYILKFIFTYLYISPNELEIIEILKILIDEWKKEGFIKLKKGERKKCEVISDLSKELKSVKVQKILKDFEFVALYILTECTSVIIKFKDTDTNNITQFLAKFIDDANIFKTLKKMSTNRSIETEMDFFSTIRNEFSKYYCTSELWQHDYYMERKYRKENPNRAVTDEVQLNQHQFTAIFMSKEKQMRNLGNADLLKISLLSNEWVENIHSFLVVFTSMRINLVSFLIPIYYNAGTDPFLKDEIMAYEFEYYELEGKSPKKNIIEEVKNNAWCQTDLVKTSGLEKTKLNYYKWKEEIKAAFLKCCQINECSSIWQRKYYKSIIKASTLLLSNPSSSSLTYGVNFQYDKIGRTPFLKELSKRIEPLTSPQIMKNTFCDELSQNLNLHDSESPKQTSKNYSDFLNQLNNTLFNTSDDENSEDPTEESGSNYEENKGENAEEGYSPTLIEKNLKYECQRIRVQGINNGIIEANQDYLIFTLKNDKKHSIDSPTHNFQSAKKDIKVWKISEIHEIFARRFIHRHSAIEFFLKSGKSLYFELTEENCESHRKELLDYFTKNLRSSNISVYGKRSSKELRNYTNSWKLGNISNFQYLMILNKFASRSFHDLSQYPIFPWVIKNWETSELDLKIKENFRNLECPVGAQNPERINDLERRYELCAESGMPPFHYGSHYSNGGLVLHYLQRIEPFTKQAKQLHGGKFDIPDRQFFSMRTAWACINSSSGDVKELIPELFYMPEVLMNINHENFGTRQDGSEVWDLELPNWARNHFDLIRKNRKALESYHVNKNLHQWIDLIFGYKQSGEYAKKAYNVYFPTTYEENFVKIIKNSQDQDFINSVIQQAIHFGQTPIKLFKGQHPKKEKRDDPRSIELEKLRSNEIDHLLMRKNEYVLSMIISQGFFIVLVYGMCSIKMKRYKIRDSKVECSYKEFIELKDTKFLYNDNDGYYKCSPYLLLKEEILVSGWYVDNTVKLHSSDGSLLGSLSYHVRPVSAIVATETQLFTGSLDTSIICWKLSSAFTETIITKKSILTGHISPIKQLKISEEYQILISFSQDNLVIFYNLRNLEITKKLAFSAEIYTIGFSDYGLLVTAGSDGIKLYTLNHIEINIEQPKGFILDKVKNIEIENSGDFILVSWDNQFIIFEPFKRNPRLPIITSGFAMFSLLQDYLIICEKIKDQNIIYTLE